MIRIDLGCGTNKQLGFIGVDRYRLASVDVLANLNERLPFHTDSVDLIFASHSLEHVDALLTTMKEIYRISKHGAQLCVLAPYSEQKLNLANPYHVGRFNEHTPRFWTSHSKTPIDPEEFNNQYADQWGLSTSDNSDPGIDIRLARIELFYFPQYVLLPISEQRRLRRERMDVCDQVLYHLIIWKGDERSRGKSFDDHVKELQPYEPESLAPLRRRKSEALLRKHAAELEELTETRSGTARDRDRAASFEELARMSKICFDQANVIRQMTTELSETASYNRVLRDEAVRTGRDLELARADLRRESARLSASQQEAASLQEDRRVLQASAESQAVLSAKLALTQAELDTTSALLDIGHQKEELLNAQVAAATREAAVSSEEAERRKALLNAATLSLRSLYDETRTQRPAMLRAAGFVIGRYRQPDYLRDSFIPLRNYCDQHFGAKGASLVLGSDLNGVPYREYEIPFDLSCLNSVVVAMRPLLPGGSGSAGIEIVSSELEILVQTILPLKVIQLDDTTEFILPTPLTSLKKRWLLRLFVWGADSPVPVYELAKAAIFRGETQVFPFVSFK